MPDGRPLLIELNTTHNLDNGQFVTGNHETRVVCFGPLPFPENTDTEVIVSDLLGDIQNMRPELLSEAQLPLLTYLISSSVIAWLIDVAFQG
jgi:hypothetical protein